MFRISKQVCTNPLLFSRRKDLFPAAIFFTTYGLPVELYRTISNGKIVIIT